MPQLSADYLKIYKTVQNYKYPLPCTLVLGLTTQYVSENHCIQLKHKPEANFPIGTNVTNGRPDALFSLKQPSFCTRSILGE